MLCPKCGATLPEGKLYCESCGEEIHVVPDYDPTLDVKIGQEEPVEQPSPGKREHICVKKKPIPLYVFLALLLLATIVLCVLTSRNLKNLRSAQYQISQAEKYHGLGDYEKALSYYSRAAELDGDNVDLLVRMAETYFLKNDHAWYEAILHRILSHPKASGEQIVWARERLIPLMVKKGDFEGVCKLISQSNDSEFMNQYQEYLSPKPTLSLEAGTYEEMQSLGISDEGTGTIYYTLDGTVPNENSVPFTLPIVLDKGEITVKACLINAYGVKSEIVTGVYVIHAPDFEMED